MRNRSSWRPTKFVQTEDGLRGSRDPAHLHPASRLQADAVAGLLEPVLRTHARGRLVDLGCGLVPLLSVYGDFVDDVVCVDWNDNQYVDQVVDLAEHLPFGDAEFDTVLLTDVLEHVPRQLELIQEVSRILRPGGAVVLSVPFLYPIHEAPHDYFRPTEYGLRWLARAAGLSVETLRPVGGSGEVLGDLVAKHVAQVPGVGESLAAGVQAAVRWFGSDTEAGRKLANLSSGRATSGYVAVLTPT